MDDRTSAAVSTKAPRRAAALVGAALLAGLLTACGSSAPTAGPATSASASVSPSASTGPSASATSSASTSAGTGATAGTSAVASPQPSAAQSTTPGIAVGERPPTAVKIPVSGYRQDSPTQLTVFFFAGVCDKYGVKVEEDAPPVVKLRVVITQTAEPGKACPQLIKSQEATVTLSKPMTGGAVVDTATGEQVPVQTGTVGGDPR